MTLNGSVLEASPPAPVLLGGHLVRLHLVGQMEARTIGNQSVLPLGRKTRALLAILALSAPRPMARARLAELLWSRRLEEQARASLRQEIHRLLEALQPIGSEIVKVTRDQLSLRAELVWTDVEEGMQATAANPAPLALVDGVLLDDFGGIDPALNAWLAVERERLRDRARALAESLLRDQPSQDNAIFIAQRLLALDRGNEGAWRALIQTYAAQGQRGLAIQTYERCRAALAETLSAAPTADTQRLVAEIRAGESSASPSLLPARDAPADRRPVPRAAAKVSVLPLQLLSSGEEESHLVAGLAEELTAALARFRWLAVVSSSSLAQFGTRDEAALHRHFGLDYLLDGTVHRVARRLRITMQLIDLRDGNQIVWARRFDRQMNDMLSLQDEIAAEIVAQIDPEIMLAEGRRAAHHRSDSPSAYDLVLRALPLISRLHRDEFTEAGSLLARALELEPDYAAAHAWRAQWLGYCYGQGWTERPEDTVAEAGRHAERAILLDPRDARAFTIAGQTRALLDMRPREALELHARALSLNPNMPMGWGNSALTYVYLGDAAEAGRRFARYRRLAAMDPNAFYYESGMVVMELLNRDYAAAVSLGRRSSEMNPNFATGMRHYLCALGHAGATAEAARVCNVLLTLRPDETVRRFLDHNPFENPADSQHYAQGLRRAGLPEG